MSNGLTLCLISKLGSASTSFQSHCWYGANVLAGSDILQDFPWADWSNRCWSGPSWVEVQKPTQNDLASDCRMQSDNSELRLVQCNEVGHRSCQLECSDCLMWQKVQEFLSVSLVSAGHEVGPETHHPWKCSVFGTFAGQRSSFWSGSWFGC